MWMYGHEYWGPGVGFPIFPFLLVLAFVFIVWAIAAGASHEDHTDSDDEAAEDATALEILKKRYARGKITKRQYLEMKKDIA